MTTKIFIRIALATPLIIVGCKTQHASESERFTESVASLMPFKTEKLQITAKPDYAELRFVCNGYIDAEPDCEIDDKGAARARRTTFNDPLTRQDEKTIWRNVVVSKKHKRVVCIDRYLQGGHTEGYVYVFQTETDQFPNYSPFHWDVSDSRNMEFMGAMLESLRPLAVRRLGLAAETKAHAPASQDDYWRMVFHADSLYEQHLYPEAKQYYRLAFTSDKYILPSHLSGVSRKMAAIGDEKEATSLLLHRMKMENDFYEASACCTNTALRDSFALREQRWNYDLNLKEQLEQMLESDQHDRILWNQAAAAHPSDKVRTEKLARMAMATDSLNLEAAYDVLQAHGFPGKESVGNIASMAVWLVFQHADLDHQKRFLPQMEEAVAKGCIEPTYLAMLKDRIDVREGRPQKYGTQIAADGKLAPVLDAGRLNEWRSEVGLPPITTP